MAVLSKISNAQCREALHPWATSCTFVTLEIFYHVFRTSFKIYGTLYLIATLLRQKSWEYVKKELLCEVLRSTVFLSINGSTFAAFLCLLRKLLGAFTGFTSGFLPALFASYIAIIVERPQRRGLLALYMFNNAIEAIFNALVSRNVIPTLSYGEVYMFCIATGLLMHLYRENKLNNGFLNRIIRFLLGEEKEPKSSTSSMYEDIYKRSVSPIKAFSIGYLIEVVPGIFKSLFQPMKIPQILVRKSNFKLGLFLGSFVSIFQFLEYLLIRSRKKQDSFNSLIAGSVSGLSMLFYRSSTISLYLFTKVAEILIKNAQFQGLLPFIPYADIIVYTISTAAVFHMCVFERHNVRTSYFNFLCHITNNRIVPACELLPKLLDPTRNKKFCISDITLNTFTIIIFGFQMADTEVAFAAGSVCLYDKQ